MTVFLSSRLFYSRYVVDLFVRLVPHLEIARAMLHALGLLLFVQTGGAGFSCSWMLSSTSWQRFLLLRRKGP